MNSKQKLTTFLCLLALFCCTSSAWSNLPEVSFSDLLLPPVKVTQPGIEIGETTFTD